MQTIIITILLIVFLRKKIMFNLGKNYYSLIVQSTDIHVLPTVSHHSVVDRFDPVNVEYPYVDDTVGLKTEYRKYKQQTCFRWLIFEFWFLTSGLSFVGQVYPRGYDCVNDTQDGINKKYHKLCGLK